MKKIVIALFLCCLAFVAFAQTKPTIAILPFTGGSTEDGETIPELFSFDQTLNSVFSPIPRTSINGAIRREQNFQMNSGMTDPETISRIGHQLGVRYIVAGTITNLGRQRLLVISIMQIENLQMIAGEWMKYTDIGDIQDKIPEMARTIIAAYRRDTSRHQKLAVLPFQTSRGDREADTLAQIFAVEIARSGTYAVFPRTKTLEQVQMEYQNQLNGDTADEYAISIGRGENPLLALSGAVRSLGANRRMFNASIINVESGVQVKGDTVNYNVIEEGVEAIWALASKLTAREIKVSNSDSFWNTIGAINSSATGNFLVILNCNINDNQYTTWFKTNGRKLITIQGDNIERVITNGKNNPLIKVPTGITLNLGNNLRLNGNNREHPIVDILEGGSLRMENGVTISGSGGGGVYIHESGSFTMSGGTIKGNTKKGVMDDSGGVYISRNSVFTMTGGNITDNIYSPYFISSGSGGVHISGTFIMSGGTISGNIGEGTSGGVHVAGTFIMSGGIISNNRANRQSSESKTYDAKGGGVYVSDDSWTGRDTFFVKTGGTIERNYATGKGNQVYIVGDIVRNRAAGPDVNLDSRKYGSDGGWE